MSRVIARAVRGVRTHRWQIVALAVVAMILVAGKTYYRGAAAGQLGWILAPTAWIVGWISGATFVFEPGAGWVSRELAYIIAPGCAGVNFALAAVLALSLGGLGAMDSARATVARLAAAVAGAYVATVVVNAARLVVAVRLHGGWMDVAQADRAAVHRALGIGVYLAGLCAVVAVARRVGSGGHRGGDRCAA